ncbi:MAG: GYD domain-containing protein [Acidiferrobacterales bacterium]
MATYVSLVSFTDQGIRNVKQSPERAQAFAEMAEKGGARVKDIYWTLGPYDAIAIVDGPDDETAMSLLLALGGAGNVRTQTMRAFSAEEMRTILGKLP